MVSSLIVGIITATLIYLSGGWLEFPSTSTGWFAIVFGSLACLDEVAYHHGIYNDPKD